MISAAEKERTAREEEEMARLLQGLVLQQAKKEEELAKRFADREKKLWAVSAVSLNAHRHLGVGKHADRGP